MGDVIGGNVSMKSHIIHQCNYSSTFKDMDGYVEKGNVRGGHGYINFHTFYQQNGLKPLINYYMRDDIEMN